MEVYFLKKLILHRSDICGRNESQNIEKCSEAKLQIAFTHFAQALFLQPQLNPSPIPPPFWAQFKSELRPKLGQHGPKSTRSFPFFFTFFLFPPLAWTIIIFYMIFLLPCTCLAAHPMPLLCSPSQPSLDQWTSLWTSRQGSYTSRPITPIPYSSQPPCTCFCTTTAPAQACKVACSPTFLANLTWSPSPQKTSLHTPCMPLTPRLSTLLPMLGLDYKSQGGTRYKGLAIWVEKEKGASWLFGFGRTEKERKRRAGHLSKKGSNLQERKEKETFGFVLFGPLGG